LDEMPEREGGEMGADTGGEAGELAMLLEGG
jgi:hypothetical protein